VLLDCRHQARLRIDRDQELNSTKYRAIHTNNLSSFMGCRVMPLVQPGPCPGSIGMIPCQQTQAHHANSQARCLPRVINSPIYHIVEKGIRGRRRWGRRGWRNLDDYRQVNVWNGGPESRDIRPQPVQGLLDVGHFRLGRGKGHINMVLD
jgi:hypothetical protein